MNSYWIIIALQILNFQPEKVEAIPDATFPSQKECAAAKAKVARSYLTTLKRAVGGKGNEVQVNAWCVPVRFIDETMEGPNECDGC